MVNSLMGRDDDALNEINRAVELGLDQETLERTMKEYLASKMAPVLTIAEQLFTTQDPEAEAHYVAGLELQGQ